MTSHRRVLITGSRTWTDPTTIRAALRLVWHPDAVLVSGGCPTGADALCETCWRAWGSQIERHPADWTRHGRSAGFRRNAEMVTAGADICLAFIRDHSPGASHTARLAQTADIPTYRYQHRSPSMTTPTDHLHHLAPAIRSRVAGWLACAERGWHLFPVRPGDKRPAIRAWQHRASSDPARLLAFYTARPGFNAGIACGPSELHVIDADMAKPGTDHHGYDSGAQMLADLADCHGGLPDTWAVATPSGGEHHYFTAPSGPALGNTARLLGPLLDTRGAGGYVLAPGCWLAPQPATRNRPGRPGGSYELLDDTDPAALPTWLHQALTETRSTVVSGPAQGRCTPLRAPGRYLAAVLRDELGRIHNAGRGQHNAAVFTAARSLGQLAAGGALDPATAEELLTRAAASIAAGPCDCTTRGLAATVRSGLAYGARRPRHLPDVEQLKRKASA